MLSTSGLEAEREKATIRFAGSAANTDCTGPDWGGGFCTPVWLVKRMKSITHSDPGVNQTPSIAHVTTPLGMSPALAEANRRLLTLRDQLKTAQPARAILDSAENPPRLPSHLGWHTPAMTQVLQRQHNSIRIVSDHCQPSQKQPIKQVCSEDEQPAPATIRAYPALLVALLRTDLTAAGRVWLLCRHLDVAGRGWLAFDELQQRLTKKTKSERNKPQSNSCLILPPSSFALFGRRRWRQILQQGRGIFWERDRQDRLWLYGAARVAVNLGVERLNGRPVLLPVAALTDTLATARAHFYAAFHSGRPGMRHDDHAAPISRATLQRLTNVPERTQRAYDRVAGVERRPAMAVGKRYSAENARETAWQRGGTFAFVDHHGQQGRAGATYVAWRLPNTYCGVHDRAMCGRHKKINQKLASNQDKPTNQSNICNDLVKTRERGNGADLQQTRQRRRQMLATEPIFERVFFDNARRATNAVTAAYWRQTASNACVIWHYIP